MASRARRDIRRNLLLILLALLALGGLIALVGLVQGGVPPVLLPEQRAEFLQRRANPADNGFADLTAAWTALAALGPVPKCDDLLASQKVQLQRSMNPGNLLDTFSSLGRFLGATTFCPNDDPRFREYMDKSEPVLAAVQAALAKPYILHTRSTLTPDAQESDSLEPLRGLLRHLTALAIYKSTVTADTERATGIIKDAIAVCQKIEASGSYDLNIADPHHGGPRDPQNFFRAGLGSTAGYPWRAIPAIAKYAVDRNDPLDALLELTRPALEDPPDRSALLLAYCMMLDDVMTGVDAPPNLRFDKRMLMAVSNRFARRDARVMVERETEVREAVNGPLREYAKKIRVVAGEGGFFGPKFMGLQTALMNVTSVQEARTIMVGLAVRLEAFRKGHGDYPEKLEELAPQYLSKIPVHPLSGDPLVYKKSKEGYVLSENGAPNMPDMHGMRFREDISFDMRVFAVPAPPVPAPPPPPN
jgi:hypothetical protein